MSTWLPLVSSHGVVCSCGLRSAVIATCVSPFFPEMKKASLFREAFVLAPGARCEPLPSRTDVRPLNEDDANKRKDEAGELHVRPVFLPNRATVNPRLGALCTAHYGNDRATAVTVSTPSESPYGSAAAWSAR